MRTFGWLLVGASILWMLFLLPALLDPAGFIGVQQYPSWELAASILGPLFLGAAIVLAKGNQPWVDKPEKIDTDNF